MPAAAKHIWTFFRAGGLDQVQIASAEDLLHLDQLDQKLWVALSCPVQGLEFDAKTLALIDSDKDGRVRVPELLAAVKWACASLKDPAQLLKSAPALPLAAINDTTPEGKSLLASARQVLINLGKPDAPHITVEDTGDTVKIFSETVFNGDGVVQSGCAKEPETKQVIEEVIATYGHADDRSGKPGVTKEKLDAFFLELNAYNAWWTAGEEASKPGSGVLPLGEATTAAYAAFKDVKGKINDWFTRCRLAAFDARSTAHLNRAETDYDALALKDLSTVGDDIAGLPLQEVAATRDLDLLNGLNPAWSGKIAAFRSLVVIPLLGAGKATLSAAEWADITARFAAFETWMEAKLGALVEKLTIARVRAILASSAKADIDALIENDLAVAPMVAAIDSIDRLTRYHRDLFTLLKNFVSFADFYDRQPPPPIFICGTLYLDQRSCDLCIQVVDVAAHSALANLGKIYLAYIACTRAVGDGTVEKMTVAAAFSQGDSDYLMVGRNGLFYDRKGRDWDANIVKILDHPISIQQAFLSPYKKIGKMISDTIEKFAGDADKSVMDKASTQVQVTAAPPAGTAPKAPPKPIDMGMLAAVGLIATSLFGALAGVAAALLSMALWKIPLVVIGVILAISGPSMIIAFLKLRQRTLGPVLEGNGWAINGRVKINIPLGTSLTGAKKLPAGSKRLLDDPFEDKAAKRRFRITIAVGILLILVAGGGWWAWQHSLQPAGTSWTWFIQSDKQDLIDTYNKLDGEATKLQAAAKTPEEIEKAKAARTAADEAAKAAGINTTPPK